MYTMLISFTMFITKPGHAHKTHVTFFKLYLTIRIYTYIDIYLFNDKNVVYFFNIH